MITLQISNLSRIFTIQAHPRKFKYTYLQEHILITTLAQNPTSITERKIH